MGPSLAANVMDHHCQSVLMGEVFKGHELGLLRL